MLLLNLLLLIQEPVPAAAHPTPPNNPAVQAVHAACVKLSEAKNYTVQQTIQDDGLGATAPADKVTVVFTAHVQKGKPTHFMQDKMEAWRDGDVLYYRTSGGTWERLGDAKDAEEGKDPKGDPDAARNMHNRMSMAQTQVAHEMLAGLSEKIATASSTKDGAKTVVTGSFTPEGAGSLGQRFTRGGQAGRTGQGGEENAKSVETTGTFRCVIAADGNLESFVFDVAAKGTAKDVPVDRKRHVELRVSAVGSTTMEVPADLKDKAAVKPDVKPVDPVKGL
jgi:hypothetical protein